MTLPNFSDSLPHEPPMVLLDSVLEMADDRVVAQACITADAPQATAQGIPSAWALEIIAQAAAFFIAAPGKEHGFTQGRVVKVARMHAPRAFLPVASPLHVEVTQTGASDAGVFLFEGHIRHGDAVLAEAAFTLFAQ